MEFLIITTSIIAITIFIAWIADANIKYIIKVVFWIIVVMVFFKIISSGLKKHEQNECTAWLKQKENIGDIWYASEWQKEMCKIVSNIEL